MRKISDKIFIGGILLASLSVIFLLAFSENINAATISSGSCDVVVEESGNSQAPWISYGNCEDNNDTPYFMQIAQSNSKAEVPSGLLNQICGVNNWTWTTTSNTPLSQLYGTFTCKTPVINSPNFIDIGFRVSQKIDVNTDEIVAIAAEPANSGVSPLKIAKNGNVYGLALVDPADPAATKALITLASGQIKALRRFTAESEQTSVNFDDQYTTASGYCVMQGSEWGMVFYGKITITNPSSIRADFTKIAIDPAGNESVRNSFSIPANSTVVVGGFGQIGPYPPCGDVQVPPPYYGMGGSADYEVRQNGTLIDTVKYSWDYTL